MKMREIIIAVGFVALCLLAGGIGSFFTFESIPTWYAGLSKPDFSPPNWVFGPVWTTLYVMMGISAYLVYRSGQNSSATARKGRAREGPNGADVRGALFVFGAQLALNTIWSIVFFGMRSPLYGLIVIIALWLAIAATIVKFYGISRTASLLLVPYILWVTFAGALNFFIWTLN